MALTFPSAVDLILRRRISLAVSAAPSCLTLRAQAEILAQVQGMRSSIFDAGQRLTSLVSVSAVAGVGDFRQRAAWRMIGLSIMTLLVTSLR